MLRNKEELQVAARENFEKLNDMIDSMSEVEMNTPFEFEETPSRKQAHWKRDKNVRDIVIHLYEWHKLLIRFVDRNMNGENVQFLPKLYTWKTIGIMNNEFYQKHQETSLDEARKLLEQSHADVMERMEQFTNEQLFLTKAFKAVNSSTLGAYFVSNTSSHYEWAMKKIKAHKKNCKGK